jgi:hypothetical protein
MCNSERLEICQKQDLIKTAYLNSKFIILNGHEVEELEIHMRTLEKLLSTDLLLLLQIYGSMALTYTPHARSTCDKLNPNLIR